MVWTPVSGAAPAAGREACGCAVGRGVSVRSFAISSSSKMSIARGFTIPRWLGRMILTDLPSISNGHLLYLSSASRNHLRRNKDVYSTIYTVTPVEILEIGEDFPEPQCCRLVALHGESEAPGPVDLELP